MCTCIGNVVIIMLQSPSYQYAKNINCNVTIVDVYTEKIDEKVTITGGVPNNRSELNNYQLDTKLDRYNVKV